jgi:hypothetical protein
MKLKITFARLYMKYLSIYSCTVEPPLSVPQFKVPHLMFQFKNPYSIPDVLNSFSSVQCPNPLAPTQTLNWGSAVKSYGKLTEEAHNIQP